MKLMTLAPGFTRYSLHERGIKAKTIKNILSVVQLLDDFLLQNEFNKITTSTIRNFLYEKKEERLWTNKTFNNYRQYLKTFFDYCILEERIRKNPVNSINKAKCPKPLPRCLNRQEIDTFLLHTDTYKWKSLREFRRNQAIVRTFLFTGIRLSELLDMRREDIDLENEEILIKNGKGDKGRYVPIGQELYPYLSGYLQLVKKGAREYVFSSLRSPSKLTEKNLYAIFKKIQKASKVYVRPHMLRHTFGKLTIEAGYEVYYLKEIFGHANLSTTERYVSVKFEKVKESFGKIQLL